MIIELCGLPASGKSTFARELAQHLPVTRVKIQTRGELIKYSLYFALKHPIFFARIFFLIVRESKSYKLFYLKFMNVLLHHSALHEKARTYEHAVLDEGHMQNLFSLFESRLDIQKVQKYISQNPMRTHVIYFDVARAVRDSWRASRKYHPRESVGGKEYQKKWEDMIECNNDVVKHVLQKSSSLFSIIHDAADVDESMSAVKTHIG